MLYAGLRFFYTVLFTLLGLPLVLLRLYWKGRKNPGYRQRILERFGVFSQAPKPGGIWVHAVSVGEFLAVVPLIKALQKRYPESVITVTTSTPTGSQQVKRVFGESVFHVYFPYDLPSFFRRFLSKIAPKQCIIVETELWPNCLEMCWQKKIPVSVVSARLSPHSFKGYRWLGSSMRTLLGRVTRVAAQSQDDGDRFVALGFNPDQLIVSGNIKFDLTLKDDLVPQAMVLRESWGKARPVVVAASTHEGEEASMINVLSELRKIFPDVLLIIVPRHPERFKKVAELLAESNVPFVSRTSNVMPETNTAVYLIDTMGELMLFYAAADVAFVAGSLVPVGGHNALEASALGVPVVMGQYVYNCAESVQFLKEANALVQVNNDAELLEALSRWIANPSIRKEAGNAGKRVVEQNRGAVEKIVTFLAIH